jgi:hypothetical protein
MSSRPSGRAAIPQGAVREEEITLVVIATVVFTPFTRVCPAKAGVYVAFGACVSTGASPATGAGVISDWLLDLEHPEKNSIAAAMAICGRDLIRSYKMVSYYQNVETEDLFLPARRISILANI